MASALACLLSASTAAYAQRPPPAPEVPLDEEPPRRRREPAAPPDDGAPTEPGEPGAEGEEGEELPYAPHPPLALMPPEELEAAGQPEYGQQPPPEVPSRTGVIVGGYLYGLGGLNYVPTAVPQFRYHFAPALGTSGALILRGNPYPDFFYVAHFGFNGEVPLAFNVFVEEASVQWGQSEAFNVKGGHMRVPFSLAQPGVITARLFVGRPQVTDAFIHGADDGIVATLAMKDQVVVGRAGIFNGASLGLFSPQSTRVAPLFLFSVFAQPWGMVPYGEVDAAHGPLRVGFGMAGAWTRGRYFDSTGHNAVGLSDFRYTASVAGSYKGVFLQAELIRRSATDDYAGRPATATGVYAQGSYFVPISTSFGIAPIGRIGFLNVDETFAPRKSRTMDVGLSFYPFIEDPTALKIILQYSHERSIRDSEGGHSVLASFLLSW